MKRIVLLRLVFSALLIGCASKSDESAVKENKVDASLDSYVVFSGESGSITYRVADYAPIEEMFLTRAEGLDYEGNYKKIEALYDELPMIGDTDNLDSADPQVKKQIMDAIIPQILNGEDVYATARKNLLASSAPVMEATSRYIDQLFPELEMDLIIVLNPFFCNGGMGVRNKLPDGSIQGRVEMGVARSSDIFYDEEVTKIFLAHELTHVIHQYLGAAGFQEMDYTRPEITVDIGLFTEGLATYVSGEIIGTSDIGKLLFNEEYSQTGPIDEDDFIQQVAVKYLDEMADKPLINERYRLWFSVNTNPEERPFPGYPAIGYFLGYYAIKYLVESNIMTITEILDTPILDMQEPIRMAAGKLAEA